MKIGSETYAVVVRDGTDLFLFMGITRGPAGDFYANLPRPHDPSIKAHASHHASGKFHVRTHGLKQIMPQDRQRPDRRFSGTSNLLDQKITAMLVRSIDQACNPAEWSEVFELPVSDLGDGDTHNTHLTADITGAGIDFQNPEQSAIHSRVIGLVDDMLTAKQQLTRARVGHEKTTLHRRTTALAAQIDQLLGELWKLDPAQLEEMVRLETLDDEAVA
jgi:hypothetical protein